MTGRVSAALWRFRAWWRAPATPRDRTSGMLIGCAAGFWIGARGRIVAGPLPVGVVVILAWGIAGIVAGAMFGRRAPKVAILLPIPLATFGCSPG